MTDRSRQLAEVAERLAQLPLAARPGSNRLVRISEGRGDVGRIATVTGKAAAWVRVVPRLMRQPDPIGTRRLYQQATGFDRDRAREDIDLVADRLAPLGIATAHGPGGDALVRSAARWLVDWVAAGRAPAEPLRGVEAAFTRWAEAAESERPSFEAIEAAGEAYVQAWDRPLAVPPDRP